MMKRIRYRFWMWVHDMLEKAWHWVYRAKVRPLQPPFPMVGNVLYTKILENDEVTIYSSSPGPGIH